MQPWRLEISSADGRRLSEIVKLNHAQSADLDRDGERVVVSGKDGVARVFSTREASPVARLPHDTPLWVNRSHGAAGALKTESRNRGSS